MTVGTSLAASTQRRALRRSRERVRALAHVERTGDGLLMPVVADRLVIVDVRLVERAAQDVCGARWSRS
jgi:hypothetical protein